MLPDPRMDGYLTMLAALPQVTLYGLLPNGEATPTPILQVDMSAIIHRLAVLETRLRLDLDMVSAEVGYWARLTAMAERLVAVRERELRVWEARKMLVYYEDKRKGEKPVKAEAELDYRTAPEYAVVYANLESAQETATTLRGIWKAFECKREVLLRDVYVGHAGTLGRLSA